MATPEPSWFQPRITYARARLRLGITSVGLWVVISTIILVGGFGPGLGLWQALLGYVALSLPLDLLGGQILPRAWQRPTVPLVRWSVLYARALTLHLAFLATGLSSVWLINRLVGPAAASLLYVLLALLLLRYQLRTLSWTGVDVAENDGVFEVSASDLRFSGGLAGLPWPGREQPVIPTHWLSPDAPVGLEYHIARRWRTSRSGARAAGALAAIAFNALGLRLALEWAGEHPVNLACAFTLWSFLGLLVLPSLSRPGVVAADTAMRRSLGAPSTAQWLGWLESYQEEDDQRPAWTERIFHPIPQWSHRQAKLDSAGVPTRPWNIARYALLTSTLAGGLLSRAVHCNCGKPELWFWPPND
jgi:hypothetical protein